MVGVAALACSITAADGSYPGADGRIAFERTSHHGFQASIYSVAADGSDLQQLTSRTTGIDEDPVYSPDGSTLAFVRDGGVWVMGPDGTNPKRVTKPPRYVVDAQPSWSPDGNRLVFVRSASKHRATADLWIVDPDGSNLQRLASTDRLDERWPSWAPDGERIAFTNVEAPGVERPKQPGIYTVAADGGGLETVTASRQQPFDSDWSPDGRTIAFVRANGGRAQLLAVDADGGKVRRLAKTGGTAGSPAYSPSGKSIAFSVGGTLCVVSSRGGEPEEVLNRPHGGQDFAATWQPLP
jgi:Tol biopolymer transport system component